MHQQNTTGATSERDYYDMVLAYAKSLDRSGNECWEWALLGGCQRPLTRKGLLELSEWWEADGPIDTDVDYDTCHAVAVRLEEMAGEGQLPSHERRIARRKAERYAAAIKRGDAPNPANYYAGAMSQERARAILEETETEKAA